MKVRQTRGTRPHHFFSREEKLRIVEAIAAAENRTSGEIRLHVETECGGEPMGRAQAVFTALGMDKTAEHNGVLIYLAVKDRLFAIIGDSGIDKAVPPGFWKETKDVMTGYFREGKFAEGVIHGVESAGEHLGKYFPRRADDVNELPDGISEGK